MGQAGLRVSDAYSKNVRDAKPNFAPNWNLERTGSRPELCFGTGVVPRLRRHVVLNASETRILFSPQIGIWGGGARPNLVSGRLWYRVSDALCFTPQTDF
ncbi:MAG: hypothetical protein ACK41O_11370 [Runella zeae]